MLNTLSPELHVRGLTLEGTCPWDYRISLAGQGLVLMPSAFWTGHAFITWDPQDKSRYVLVYPARLVPSEAFESGLSPERAGDPLALLLGATRATVLRALGQPLSTTRLARHVGISPSSASDHAATLRAAGLITSERQGKAVIHEISALGSALLWRD